jgi:hypothetical protein
MVGLVWLAAQEVAASRNNDTYQEYAGAALARMVSVSVQPGSEYILLTGQHLKRFVEMDSLALCESLARYEEYQELKVAEM